MVCEPTNATRDALYESKLSFKRFRGLILDGSNLNLLEEDVGIHE